MHLGAAHWVFLTGIIVIIAVMIARKNVVIPAIAATFCTALAYDGSPVRALQSVFNASLTAATELFSIFLIIALVTALLGALRALGADRRMVEPFRHVMRGAHSAFWVIAGTTYVISLFFWPTPAVPLIGAILLPAAISAGLRPISAALAIAIAGQGMALSSDYVIQVAPGLSAKAAGVDTGAVADRAMVLSLITGAVALAVAYLMSRREMRAPDVRHLARWEAGEEEEPAARPARPARRGLLARRIATAAGAGGASGGAPPAAVLERDEPRRDAMTERALGDGAPGGRDGHAGHDGHAGRSKAFAMIVPIALAALLGYMMLGKFTGLVPEVVGGDAAALVGGTAVALLVAAALSRDGLGCLESCGEHIVDGLVFAVKAMGVVIPIAGFFFLGNADFAGRIMALDEGATAPGFLFDLTARIEGAVPDNGVIVGLALLLVGLISGLDGSGFSGLPMTGSLAGSLGPASGTDPALLAAIGQMGSIWAGGGVLIAWSSLLAVAGFARVPVLELVRRAFLPVVAGLVVATLAGIAIF
ncbi:hypothetical protein [Actinomadura sp. WMMB 499]|uniref:hypothetical protein n=1 Tax=Actinomadura sp. WMMB 499 TaxID=1219491 RepID=UPI001245C82E|nr:hypothetical protein [Actinomadura sp. WMMB 499]QFG25021.1 hypothetical protein F7P10_31685 [Actinomadura sp. WMMB 499]